MKQPERTAPESRTREIRSYGLMRGRGKRSLSIRLSIRILSLLHRSAYMLKKDISTN